MNIAVIPARGGSKRIPRKNIKVFGNKPMIAHAIAIAKESGIFERIVVSTEDKEIAEIAKQWGAEIPFERPVELSDDYTTTVPVVAHAIKACQDIGWAFENVCCIYPGVPFMQSEDLIAALEIIKNKSVYCFPVAEFPSAIQRALRRSDNGIMQPFYPEYELARTQDLEKAYHDAGQFYWGKTETWTRNSNLHSGGIGYLIPQWRVVDIDTVEDWKRAEVLYNSLTL